MKTFFIADTHFGHKRILELSAAHNARPFRTIDEMDKTMIKKWNSVVSKHDTVFHLGDFSFCDFGKTQQIFYSLNGRIHLIMGNHDRHHSVKWFKDVGFHQVYEYPICYKRVLWLSHAPMLLDMKTHYVNIHGHTHSLTRFAEYASTITSTNHLSVCVDVIDYTPILLEDLINNAPYNHKIKEADMSSYRNKELHDE
ncbi:MAG: metallophosphoesterase [Oscillospiraceae bacterium]|jgi:calcineurin-like phosphoesterase family protein|nr:metallophosphoesterase [Oscillospiraceae bacterium]